MTEDKKIADPKPVAENKADYAHKITRRRFTKAGAAAPFILTLASRPVWGDVCTESALGSMTHASHAGTEDGPDTCRFGCAPGTWLEIDDATWPIASSTDFGTLFTATGTVNPCPCFGNLKLDEKTLLQVLNGSALPNNPTDADRALILAAQEATAALLNIAAVTNLSLCVHDDYTPEELAQLWYPLTVDTVKTSFNDAFTTACPQDGCNADAFDEFVKDMQDARAGAVCPIPYIDCMADE